MQELNLDQHHPRLILGPEDCEDASIISFPEKKALIQTVDFFTPIVNDPYKFGQIAAANALSDVYAMGGTPLAAMNIVLFPVKKMDKQILAKILQGGLNKIKEAGAIMAGGHSVEDDEIKYGLAVSGVVEPDRFATNKGLTIGDQLILTKPLGTGVLATALKAEFGDIKKIENDLYTWAARLNKFAGQAIEKFRIKGATDITGFGLGGHILEMARASKVVVEIYSSKVPVLDSAKELAAVGMIPAGSYANKHFCECSVSIEDGVDPLLIDLIFDAQTSGGLVLAVAKEKVDEVSEFLTAKGDLAEHIGQVVASDAQGGLILRP